MTTDVLGSELKSPVMGELYLKTLAGSGALSAQAVREFLSQWHGFSSFIPRFLCLAAYKAETEEERLNVLENLNSELGMDGGSTAHAEMLRDLIERATGNEPQSRDIKPSTAAFLETLEQTVLTNSAAFNSGVMAGLEHVAYDILSVLKEILSKCGRQELILHPYIVIHDEIEKIHIENTQENIGFHGNKKKEVDAGFKFIMRQWKIFWDSAYLLLTPGSV